MCWTPRIKPFSLTEYHVITHNCIYVPENTTDQRVKQENAVETLKDNHEAQRIAPKTHHKLKPSELRLQL